MTEQPKKKYSTANRPRRRRSFKLRLSEAEYGKLVKASGGVKKMSAWVRKKIQEAQP